MKAKLLAFAFFYFCKSRFFKGLRAKKIKKSDPLSTRARGCASGPRTPYLFDSAFGGRGLESGEQKTITQTQDLRKQLRGVRPGSDEAA
jgi:hypothetical protein